MNNFVTDEDEEKEEKLGSKRKLISMNEEKFDVDQTTNEIILKEDTYIYIPCSECATELDTPDDAIITLLNHLERDFKVDEENFVRYHSKGYQLCLLRFYTKTIEEAAKESEVI